MIVLMNKDVLTSENEKIILDKNSSSFKYQDDKESKNINFNKDIEINQGSFSTSENIYNNESLSNIDLGFNIIDEYNKILNRTKEKIFHMMINDVFEIGYYSKTSILVSEMLANNNGSVFEALRYIVIENYRDIRILNGVLSILSDLDYTLCLKEGVGILLMLGAYNNESIKEAMVRIVENWNNKDTLQYLEMISFKEKWLEEYKINVMNYIKEYGNEGISKVS